MMVKKHAISVMRQLSWGHSISPIKNSSAPSFSVIASWEITIAGAFSFSGIQAQGKLLPVQISACWVCNEGSKYTGFAFSSRNLQLLGLHTRPNMWTALPRLPFRDPLTVQKRLKYVFGDGQLLTRLKPSAASTAGSVPLSTMNLLHRW